MCAYKLSVALSFWLSPCDAFSIEFYARVASLHLLGQYASDLLSKILQLESVSEWFVTSE